MRRATWIVVTCFLAFGCGPGDSSPPEPATSGARQPAADGPVPAAAPRTGRGARTAERPDAGEPRPVERQGRGGACIRSPSASDWEIRKSAQGHGENGESLGALPELVRVRCGTPTVAGGRGCFENAEIDGLGTDVARICFDEADVVEIYREQSRRLPPPCRVTVGRPVIKGPFPAGEIERLVASLQEPLLLCVSHQVVPGVDLDDRVEVSFVIQPRNSRVEDIQVRSGALSPETRECVARCFGSLRIPATGEGRDTRVRASVEIEAFVAGASRQAAEP